MGIKNIDNKDVECPQETRNLLIQAYKSLNNAEKLFERNELTDVMTLLRSCFENVIMGMMIMFDINTYIEFKKVDLQPSERKYTKPETLRNKFRKKIKIINKEVFGKVGTKKIGALLDDLYNKMSLYTHSSIVASLMIEVKKNNDEDIFAIFIKHYIYFMKILLHDCLKYTINSDKMELEYSYILVGYFGTFFQLDSKKISSEYLEKYNKYFEISEKGKVKNEEDIVKIRKEIADFIKVINSNPKAIIKWIKAICEENDGIN